MNGQGYIYIKAKNKKSVILDSKVNTNIVDKKIDIAITE